MIAAARYLRAVREGSSVPALVEADDGGTYLVKLRCAAQGPRTLIAELLGGRLAAAAGLDAPAPALITIDAAIAEAERHQEIREGLHRSVGVNLALPWLADAKPFRVGDAVDPALAARIVAFDAFLDNVDRTARNPNLVWSGGRLWLIDHGAALAWQHGWRGGPAKRRARLPDHVLGTTRADLTIDPDAIRAACAEIPLDWLDGVPASAYADVLIGG